jgi:hypothetical protein
MLDRVMFAGYIVLVISGLSSIQASPGLLWHRAQGRYSLHFALLALHGKQAADALVRLANRCALINASSSSLDSMRGSTLVMFFSSTI